MPDIVNLHERRRRQDRYSRIGKALLTALDDDADGEDEKVLAANVTALGKAFEPDAQEDTEVDVEQHTRSILLHRGARRLLQWQEEFRSIVTLRTQYAQIAHWTDDEVIGFAFVSLLSEVFQGPDDVDRSFLEAAVDILRYPYP